MSRPRHILAGRVWFLTRRTTRRHRLLRPDSDGTSQALYWYTTAVLAAKFGIVFHAVQVLSTHIHEVVTDTLGNLPAFIRERNRALANALKCHRGWPEEVFQRAPASCVELYGPDAILKQIGYTVANCVEAGLVESPEQWPGVRTSVDDIGTTYFEAERPKMYFDPENPVWPDKAGIQFEMPKPLVDSFGEQAKRVLRRAAALAVERARISARAAGRFVGNVARLLRTPVQGRSRTFEVFGRRNPHFAAGGNLEQARRAVSERRTFLTAYRAALDAWQSTREPPLFPDGTWRWIRELLTPRSRIDGARRMPRS